MGSFCKQDECPASDALVALNEGDAGSYTLELEKHLMACEFCSAEVDLYRHYPPVEEDVPVEQMPRPLFELAEALLRRDNDMRPLYRLVERGD